MGIPLPEELTLITAGYLVYRGVIGVPALLLVICVAAILLGDTMLFGFGHWLGGAAERSRWVRRIASPKRRALVNGWFERFGVLTVLFARYLPGLRAPAYFVAGTTTIRYRRFLAVDAVAACLSTPLWLWLGWWFGDSIDELVAAVARARTVSMIVVAAVALAVVLWFALVRPWWRRRRAAAGPVQ